MKKLLLTFSFFWMVAATFAQTISIVSPEGLPFPYEVAPGTEVTIQWDYFGETATLFSHNEDPMLDPFFPDPAWGQDANAIDNGDGTFNFTLTVNDPIYVWGGFYQEFFGQYAYSNVISIGIASSVVIDYEDGLVCPDGTGTELLSVADTYDTYQWYKDGDMIDGANAQTYSATEAGNYKVQVPVDGTPTYSNALNIESITNQLGGTYDEMDNEVDMTATAGFDSYQWLSGPDADNLTDIPLANSDTYSAPITSTTTYYAVAGTLNGCTVTTEANPVGDSTFEIPMITIAADTNEFGNVCEGTTITLTATEGLSSYQWFKNGFDAFNTESTMIVNQSWNTGEYYVVVSPEGWPNIQLQSESVDATYFTVTAPQLFTSVPGPYCPETSVSVVLSDEGYDYTWYVHSEFNYTEEDEVSVDDVTLALDFTEATYVTVVGENQGCSASSYINLNSAGDQSPYVQIPDWQTGSYLCADSTILMQISTWNVDDYTNFQWYTLENDVYTEIDGAIESSYEAPAVAVYVVRAELVACPGLIVESNQVEIQSFMDRELYIYPNQEELCIGDETEIFVSSASDWQNIQWFNFDIQIGSGGYENVEQVIIDAGSETSYTTGEFNTYYVKGRHHTCPTGPKLESNHIQLRPSVNPDISVDPNYGVNNWHVSAFDSVPSYLYCEGEGVDLQLPDTYDSYEWYSAVYQGGDDYELGEQLTDFTENQANVTAFGVFWVTALVEEAGCLGMSDPVLIDTWAFASPTVTSYNNSEICEEGDSTLVHVSFPGNYANVEWLHDGVLIPEENGDSLYAMIPGEYIVIVYREECPQFAMNSGQGPHVTILADEVEIIEETDVIYAWPFQGFYDFQWYLDGEPIESVENTPWLQYKDEMATGVYTVEITNPEPCTVMSEPFVWIVDGVNDISKSAFTIYPNPASDNIQIMGDDFDKISEIAILDISGKTVLTTLPNANINISALDQGVYILRLTSKDGTISNQKWVKN